MKKRGMEALVATVLLVLITIAAVGIVWGAIMPLINTSIESSQKCMNVKLGIDTQKGFTYSNATGTSVMISREESDIALVGAKLKLISSTGSSKTVSLTDAELPASNTETTKVTADANMKYAAVIAVIQVGTGNKNITHECAASPDVPLPFA